jgi:hypothetical protein
MRHLVGTPLSNISTASLAALCWGRPSSRYSRNSPIIPSGRPGMRL